MPAGLTISLGCDDGYDDYTSVYVQEPQAAQLEKPFKHKQQAHPYKAKQRSVMSMKNYFGQNATDCGEEYEYMCALASLSNAQLILGLKVVTPQALLDKAYQMKLLQAPMLGTLPDI